ncbi:MAG: putative metallopeptidase [Armatimonadota bacterium]|nr:putative metallopeptidase [Armatimonadota bacterium]MDR7401083.1 putative metallopeptidase [Armatimonadota bacterium]MDR7403565.1 putative metallopeptidase [Armatimonadota bacterium]MDR7436378.1 putative metallopeptidase [Armatimonadota bacterium]MDR7471735.1 putative metallopeptidase [Armatimonadota bacterium]
MQWHPAGDLAARLRRIVAALRLDYIDPARVRCVRVTGSRANALARIWGLPPVFQRALRLPAHYVIEFMVPAFDRLRREEQDRVIIHELLHIPRTFSGGIRPESSPPLRISRRTVEQYYRQYLAAMRGRVADGGPRGGSAPRGRRPRRSA